MTDMRFSAWILEVSAPGSSWYGTILCFLEIRGNGNGVAISNSSSTHSVLSRQNCQISRINILDSVIYSGKRDTDPQRIKYIDSTCEDKYQR